MDNYFSSDFETIVLLSAVENGNIRLNCVEGKCYNEETEVTNKLERSGWDATIENDFQLFERYNTTRILE